MSESVVQQTEGKEMSNDVFVYWDNSNIFYEAQRLAEEKNEGPNARYRVRINFDNMLHLAYADRSIKKAIAVGSIPPEVRQLWNRMESRGVEVQLFDRMNPGRSEQEMPDRLLQLQMLRDGFDNNGNPGVVVLLTGDGAGCYDGVGFHRDVERMYNRGWKIEILSWAHSCNQRMKKWAQDNGIFVSLDDFYDSITFLEPSSPGTELAEPRDSLPVDLTRRLLS